MKKSQNYNLRLPERVAERNDPADIDDLTYDMEAIDRELARQKRTDEDLEKLKAGKAELNAHSSAAVLAHPDGSVTDEKLGSRAMGSVRDKLQRLLELVGEQLAAILYRFAQHMGYDTEGQADLSGFTDLAQVSTYAREAMAWCVDAGLLSGTSPTTLSPRGQATRAQTAAVLMRLCQGYGM